MSRRVPNPAADRAAQNQQTIKTLLKLEGNKSCADCKRNKHPRWASWNLGIFVCIRCSGIHRGMGTHISRVKSVDLDAWTDEQLQSILRWGNSRANKYWEAKLAPGHVPSDAKIENFIRTKYESKRWVMDGPMPDPATLADDDDVPLNVVQEKAKLERSSSQRAQATFSQPPPPMPRAARNVDLFGDVPAPPARPSTTDVAGSRPPPPRNTAPPKQSKPADSLLGLDFFGGPPSASSGRPSSAASTPATSTGPSRPDLKQSILSLYASAPPSKPQSEAQNSFSGTQSPPAQQQSNFGDMNDAFSGLSFTAASPPPSQSQQQPKPDPFSSFSKPMTQPSKLTSPLPISGGGFFDTSPKVPQKPSTTTSQPPQTQPPVLSPASSNAFGDFSFAATTSSPVSKQSATTTSTSADLFDFFSPSPPKPAPAPTPSSNINSAFNLSTPAQPAPKSTPLAPATTTTTTSFSNFSAADAWGSNDAWATPDLPATTSKPQQSKPTATAPKFPESDFSGWGSGPGPSITSSSGTGSKYGGAKQASQPKIAPDEDFGGWNSAVPETPVGNPPPVQKPSGGGFGGGDILENPWG